MYYDSSSFASFHSLGLHCTKTHIKVSVNVNISLSFSTHEFLSDALLWNKLPTEDHVNKHE